MQKQLPLTNLQAQELKKMNRSIVLVKQTGEAFIALLCIMISHLGVMYFVPMK
jgi:hypothetical protein